MTKALIEEGDFSQQRLANELKARGIRCSQPMIWRILNVPDFDPIYSVGDAIKQLHEERLGGGSEELRAMRG